MSQKTRTSLFQTIACRLFGQFKCWLFVKYPLGTIFNKIWFENQKCSYDTHLKISSANRWPFCRRLSVFNKFHWDVISPQPGVLNIQYPHVSNSLAWSTMKSREARCSLNSKNNYIWYDAYNQGDVSDFVDIGYHRIPNVPNEFEWRVNFFLKVLPLPF